MITVILHTYFTAPAVEIENKQRRKIDQFKSMFP